MADDAASRAARLATTSVELPRFETVLLGTFGPEQGLAALVRLPGGRRLRVHAGDRIGGARVIEVAPGRMALSYGSDVLWLSVPGS